MIEAFNSTSRYLDDLFNINNIHFEQMVHKIYPAELQLNKVNAFDTEAAFIDLNLSIHNHTVSSVRISVAFRLMCVRVIFGSVLVA